eukprot:CAMPEP_0202035560 /NCGR_PEP_ID=MMETSP0962-20130828/958_1 /ASSEMBLY_ACC=CAM_ASM_000488 /TAXON_ID=4773 /ORGANISM="Schizochytrium aggregatum, Strain ATCC28209" /LENGTH=209 /DNA_ID=CAMNT_0048599577 /DNA_START=302 /DNA_END=931 /DNA_ORIENTATION=+
MQCVAKRCQAGAKDQVWRGSLEHVDLLCLNLLGGLDQAVAIEAGMIEVACVLLGVAVLAAVDEAATTLEAEDADLLPALEAALAVLLLLDWLAVVPLGGIGLGGTRLGRGRGGNVVLRVTLLRGLGVLGLLLERGEAVALGGAPGGLVDLALEAHGAIVVESGVAGEAALRVGAGLPLRVVVVRGRHSRCCRRAAAAAAAAAAGWLAAK